MLVHSGLYLHPHHAFPAHYTLPWDPSSLAHARFFFSFRNRWESGENPTHDVSCWHLVESKTCDDTRQKSVYMFQWTGLIYCNFWITWDKARIVQNSILQKELLSPPQIIVINRIFLATSPHSSSECYITGQLQKASSHRQATIWAIPSVDSKGTEAS